MKAIIGLGNPGIKYMDTRHNIGFMILDEIVKIEGYSYRNDFKGKVAEGNFKGERVFYLKPYTYMNLSGLAAAQLAGYYKIASQDLLIIHDDMDLALGRVRLRPQGGSGGHNGIKSIIAELNTQEFWRLRIGVGRPAQDRDVVSHVLSSFQKDEKKILDEVLEQSIKIIELWLENRGNEAMNIYNKSN